jgi:hypothetical protein
MLRNVAQAITSVDTRFLELATTTHHGRQRDERTT